MRRNLIYHIRSFSLAVSVLMTLPAFASSAPEADPGPAASPAPPAPKASAGSKVKFGDFNHWVTRHIKESGVIGGHEKTVYAIGPDRVIEGNKPYRNAGGSPWATSNVMAKVAGVVKTSNAVYPAVRSGNDRCARLATQMESIKVLGLVNMDVMVAGSMFLGEMLEPIKSTSNPYSKMDMGVTFSGRPQALVFDYKVDMPPVNTRTKSTGFSAKKTLPGHDEAVTFVMLQRRWEDEDGNLHARRVGSAGELYTRSTPWQNGHRLPIVYGDASSLLSSHPYLKLRSTKDTAYYARNSKGKMVPVIEEGWDSADASPTHAIVMFSAGSGEPYIGTEGLTLYIDNVAFD
ncbi:MAG: PCMD domain-containing protein [Duncaniella sp.]|nr:PCMD domain-containing protein [Duncaniella sp.]